MIWRAFYSTCAGIFTFAFAAILFWYFLPDAGQIHQYVNAAICASFAFLVGLGTPIGTMTRRESRSDKRDGSDGVKAETPAATR